MNEFTLNKGLCYLKALDSIKNTIAELENSENKIRNIKLISEHGNNLSTVYFKNDFTLPDKALKELPELKAVIEHMDRVNQNSIDLLEMNYRKILGIMEKLFKNLKIEEEKKDDKV